MTLLESYARPRRLIEIFVLRLKGFKLTEQLKDQIAIILYQPEPAILRSKFSLGIRQWHPSALWHAKVPAFSPTLGTVEMNSEDLTEYLNLTE